MSHSPGVRAKRRRALRALLAVGAACATGGLRARPQSALTPPGWAAVPEQDHPPTPLRELRGAWVATVARIDWPSRPGLPAAALKAEAQALVQRAAGLGLNAIVLQVRASADAIYPSTLEPWSEWLSGTQGQPPWRAGEVPWDPLAHWVGLAHAHGMELHAWFNPYRARHSTATSPPVAPHVAVNQPHWVRRYGEQLWLDPAEPGAAAQLLAVVADVVRRYDIDAVHLDDYFYPYPITSGGQEQDFPDDAPWALAQMAGTDANSRADWRRGHVNRLVKSVYQQVHAIKPWVRVGISPFGIGKPALRPAGITGFSQFDKLYADVELWLQAGWLDYLAPQLYWTMERNGQALPALLQYWAQANAQRQAHGGTPRHLWPGLFTSAVRRGPHVPVSTTAWPAQELLAQVRHLQEQVRGPAAVQGQDQGAARASAAAVDGGGHLHFSAVALLENRDGVATALASGPYAQPALPPATPWLAKAHPPALRLTALGRHRLAWAPVQPQPTALGPLRWLLWHRQQGVWRWQLLRASAPRWAHAQGDAMAVQAVDRLWQLGPVAAVARPVGATLPG